MVDELIFSAKFQFQFTIYSNEMKYLLKQEEFMSNSRSLMYDGLIISIIIKRQINLVHSNRMADS